MSEEKTSKKVSIWAYILIGAAGLGILMFDIPNIGQSGSQTIAKIGDRDISLPELNNAVSRLQSQLPDLPAETLQRQALHHLTRQALLEQHALDSNFTYPDAELHNELKREFGNDEAYQTWLRQRNISAAAYQESLRRNGTIGLYYQTLAATAPKDDILFTALLDDLAQTHDYTAVRLPLAPAAQALSHDENAIKAWYDAHPDAFMTRAHQIKTPITASGVHYSAVASFNLARAAVTAFESTPELAAAAQVHVGTIISRDHFYFTPAGQTELLASYGVLGVEMEAASLYATATQFSKEALHAAVDEALHSADT